SAITHTHSSVFNLLLLYHFFYNPTPTPEIYTLSLHDALPIFRRSRRAHHRRRARPRDDRGGLHRGECQRRRARENRRAPDARGEDRKSTRLNSSHRTISYAVFCLKKKKKKKQTKTAIIRYNTI